jgi:hypothetical protein
MTVLRGERKKMSMRLCFDVSSKNEFHCLSHKQTHRGVIAELLMLTNDNGGGLKAASEMII